MQTISDYLSGIVLFGLLSAVVLWIAKRNGFFRFPQLTSDKQPRVSLKSLLVVFAIYLVMTMVVAPFLVYVIKEFCAFFSLGTPPPALFGWLQMLLLLSIFLLFFLYSKAYDFGLFKGIWKNKAIADPKPILSDFFMGIGTWIIGFPLILAVGQTIDMLLHYFFGYQSYEQVAVRYLKDTLASPPMLVVALFTILFAAPIIEEFLFRGCLQTFFKRWVGQKMAIVSSALCFALFHYASSQGIGNISLILSLFTFALFLGFIYERQASLFASIGLHMTFNTVSTLRILLFPEG